MLGERLRKLRILHHQSQAQIAQLLNISRSAYSMYESGKRQVPYESLFCLADYYKVSVDYLLDRTQEPGLPEKLTAKEKQLLKQFRKIDERGQDTIFALLRYECARIAEKDSSLPK